MKIFLKAELYNADLSGAVLRGVDYTVAILTNDRFTKCKTRLKPNLVFIFALLISLISGYFVMLLSQTIQFMINSPEANIVTAGYITAGFIFFL